MYKKNRFKSAGGLGQFLRKKGMVQLFPTLVFSITYSLIRPIPYHLLLMDKAKCGYWFTYTLFFYFLIYAVGDFFIGRKVKGKAKVLVGGLFTLLIYGMAKFSLSSSCPWSSNPICGIIGFANFQYFIFFYWGSLVRAYFDYIEQILKKDSVITGIIVGFLLIQLILHLPLTRAWMIKVASYSAYSLLRSFSGFFGIAAIFVLFRRNEAALRKNRVGEFLQFIGTRTLDIYLIHTILVLSNMRFFGTFFVTHDSYVVEMILGGAVALVIIGLCLLISEVIRCSDTLAQLLLGKVIK